MLSLAPRRSERALQSVCARPCCLHPWKEGSASGVLAFRGHLWVHFRYGPVTCSPSQGWLCQLASSASFPPHGCNPSYGALTFTPVGLSPTEHASLDWTHSPRCFRSLSRSSTTFGYISSDSQSVLLTQGPYWPVGLAESRLEEGSPASLKGPITYPLETRKSDFFKASRGRILRFPADDTKVPYVH